MCFTSAWCLRQEVKSQFHPFLAKSPSPVVVVRCGQAALAGSLEQTGRRLTSCLLSSGAGGWVALKSEQGRSSPSSHFCCSLTLTGCPALTAPHLVFLNAQESKEVSAQPAPPWGSLLLSPSPPQMPARYCPRTLASHIWAPGTWVRLCS